MEQDNECEKKKDMQPEESGAGFDILRKDTDFWREAVKSLASEKISEARDGMEINVGKALVKHPEKVFCIHCKCSKCLIFRKLIIGIHMENAAYNDLWEKLREIITSYYTMLPAEQDSVINRKYQELQKESCGIRWYSDGSIDVKKNIHVAMGNYFSLSNEMTFIIVFNMLILRDIHQLFELLCLQLTSIILAYREGIKEMTVCTDGDEEYYKPEEFLNYILNGYERITQIADTLTPLVIEMRDHLTKFSLTWQLLNQCMYYRFLYVDIEGRMADCILRLKDAVPPETYKNFVYRFIKFDEEMTQIGQVWEVAIGALELYRTSTPEHESRVERRGMIHQIIQSLRELKEVPADATVNQQALALNWIVSSEKDDVWLGVLNVLKNESCYRSNEKQPCKCWACVMSEGNVVPDILALPDTKPKDVKKSSSDEYYHLAWAVFQHLKDREPYTKQVVQPEMFCAFNDPPCKLTECQVATNLIIGYYPLSFTKFLLRTYQPLSTADREKFLKVPSQSLIRKFCLKKGGAAAKEIMQEADEINHSFLLLNMFWDDDDIADPLLRAGLAAALAENFKIDVKFPYKSIIFSYFYALFRMDPASNEILMDMEWLEKVNIANLFKSFGVISNSIHDSSQTLNTATNTVEAIEMTLNELKITAEVSAGSSSNALDLVQFSMKEVADKLSSISLTDDNTENAKKVLENEIKKPLVEALKLAASNKKLEAELKSLQKEHNMLKDMVKGLEQIHGEKKEVQVTVTATTTIPTESNPTKCGHAHGHHNRSQSGSSSPSTSDVDHGKDSGADCVCYYCTLFGKNQDLMNSRSTETRDRLRKRLHQLQSQKDFSKTKNLKNISLLLKNGAAAAAASTPKVTKTPETTTTTTTHKCSSGATNGPSMKMKVELELQQRKKKANLPKPSTSKPVEVKIQRATEINLKSLENLVEYIEGPSSKAVVEQKKADEAAAKKQQKKAKQLELKIRRQIDEQIEQLNIVNADLQEVVVVAKQVKNQVSQLRAGKGKNKELKKVKMAEDKLTELTALRQKLENEAKGIFREIKDLNPSTDLFQECFEMKTVMELLGPPPPQQYQPPKPKPQAPIQIQCPPPAVKVQLQSSSSNEEDPAKRMVTIRRINLPHAEPQVTVTAKGTTPDMDQLLYTFVNGQLVPASSLSPSAFQNGSIQLFMSSNGQTKMVMENHQNQMQKIAQSKSDVSHQQQQQQQPSEKINKKKQQTPTPTPIAMPEKASKKDVKKKKEEAVVQPTPVIKKDTKVMKAEKPAPAPKPVVQENNNKKKMKKAYIDPEFAANPFKLLDDEEPPSESEEEVVESPVVPVEPVRKVDEDFKKVKSSREEKKANKKLLAAAALQAPKKNQQTVVKGKTERKDSVASASSSNASKDSKPSIMMNQDFPMKPTEMMNRPTMSPHQTMMNSNSIMEQLNRGVRVEGLRLPPGITLTKVAPFDSLGMKRESINRLAQPMQDYSNAPPMPAVDPNGIITVEANPGAEAAASKKKNKKKKAKSEMAENQAHNQQQPPDRMVTLKNPMFYNNPTEPIDSMMRNIQTPPFVSPLTEAQTASIVRNENGMYTIRNPTFTNAFDAGKPTQAPAFAHREEIPQTFAPSQFAPFEGDAQPMESSQPKCSSVIGSEMKMMQRRKEQEFTSNIDPYQQYGARPQSAYSHFGGPGVNFNNNGTHCDDSFMNQQSASGFQNYQSSLISNFDDLRLQPGQMLNSEVTIHNVTESKMFQNQAKKTPPPIGTPRNGNTETLFGDLLITRPSIPPKLLNGNDSSIFISTQNKHLNDIECERDLDNFKRYDFNHIPPKQSSKCSMDPKKSSMTHANSTNSNSPISVTSSDETFESGNLPQKTSFYHNFSDDKSSGASSLFSQM